MKVAIIYDSVTGNTKAIAEKIEQTCKKLEITCVLPEEEADLYFIGSWTDKGNCSAKITTICKKMHNKKMALFGTCGFGGTGAYQEALYQRFAAQLPEDNEILGHFYCMGKMPISTRNRYVAMLQEHPEDKQLAVSITNFDVALTHPNQEDFENAEAFVKEVLRTCQ